MLQWYKELSLQERRTFWACLAGWTLDAMDAQLFSFIAPALMVAWKLSSGEIGYLGTVAMLATAIGGWIAGGLADRYGRVRVLQVTVLWFAFFTFLAGFAQNFNQLFVIRILQGFGFGGEWGAGAVLMGEIIRPQHRGKAVGCVQGGYGIGWTLATILSTVGFSVLPPDYAWRALLWVGVLPALLVIFVRRTIKEPEVFRRARALREVPGMRVDMLSIFRPDILVTTGLASLLALGVIGAGSAIIFWLPTYLKTVRHLDVAGVGTYMLVITIGSFIGFVGSAYLSDMLGRRRNFMLMASCSWVIALSYMYLPLQGLALLALSLPLGFCLGGSYSTLGLYFTELFPTAIRGSAQSFAYNFGKSAGALAVAAVGLLAERLPLGETLGMVSLCTYALALLATLLLPETRGRELVPDGLGAQPGRVTPVNET